MTEVFPQRQEVHQLRNIQTAHDTLLLSPSFRSLLVLLVSLHGTHTQSFLRFQRAKGAVREGFQKGIFCSSDLKYHTDHESK